MAQLTDQTALHLHRRRALAGDPAFFLQDAMADEVQERLEEVNRSFTDVAVVTPFPDVWRPRLPDAHIIPDADVLDLDEAAFDLVIHALSLHWAQDVVGQLVQCRRALRPDGLFIGTTFGGQTLNELRTALAEAEVRVTGGLSPRVAPMPEIRDLGALIQRAGLALPVADAIPLTVTYASPFHLMQDLRAMGETNALSDRIRHFTRRNLVTEAAQIYVETYGDDDGRIPATFEVITLTGWSPDSSQQQPLRPGSATTRLADALGVDETPADWSDD